MPTNNNHSEGRPRKLQRISQACDLCHRRSIRCRPSAENPQQKCQNCYDFDVDCTYNRPSRRRRNQSAAQTTPPNILPSQRHLSPGIKSEGQASLNSAGVLDAPDYPGSLPRVLEGRQDNALAVAWRSFATASSVTIERCLEIYMDVVYPMFPLFHSPTLFSQIRRRQHLNDRGFFASVMAACALAAARARDGAPGDRYNVDESIDKSSEVFFAAAQDAIPKDLSMATGLGYLRACALLAITSIQFGQITTMHQYMGHYHTLCNLQHFHEEERWPAGLSVEEREERRRLFWAMYSWEIYTCVVFGTMPRTQDVYSNVRYPIEVNDEELSATVQHETDPRNWLRGWNFGTDLYRVLEHAMKRLQRNQGRGEDRVSIIRMLMSDGIPNTQVLEELRRLCSELPERFKNFRVLVTGDRSQDIFGFQAANIQATLHLVSITLLQTDNWQDIHQKCEVVEQVLETFRAIEAHYLRAISTPLVYHLGTIGQILSSLMQGRLREDSYQRVRDLLKALADLLKDLETGLQPVVGVSEGLRARIDHIDTFMEAQRQMLATNEPATHSLHPMLNGVHGNELPTNMPQVTNGFHPNGIPVMNELGMRTPLDEFQLPADIVGEWGWPFDFSSEANGSHPHHPNGFHLQPPPIRSANQHEQPR